MTVSRLGWSTPKEVLLQRLGRVRTFVDASTVAAGSTNRVDIEAERIEALEHLNEVEQAIQGLPDAPPQEATPATAEIEDRG